MKLKGFTIAEILVAITLIGVIAVLTIGALYTNMQKSQVGPVLTKAIATLDNANAIMVQEQDMYSFSGSCSGTPFAYDTYTNRCFEPYIMKTIGAAKVDLDNTGIKYEKYPYIVGTVQTAPTFNRQNAKAYKMKSGFTYIFSDLVTQSSPALNHFQTVYVDINGYEKGPNAVAKDLFLLAMDLDDGKVYAYASKYMATAIPAGYHAPSWEGSGRGCNALRVLNALTCAGSVIDNNGKVIYKY